MFPVTAARKIPKVSLNGRRDPLPEIETYPWLVSLKSDSQKMSLAKLTNHVLPIRNQVGGYTPAVPLRPSPSHYSSSKTNAFQ